MGSNMIVAIVTGAILVIVGFSLWPVLNGANNSLYAYFRNSCNDGNGNRFLKAYIGDDTELSALPSSPDKKAYYTSIQKHGGPGVNIADNSGGCMADVNVGARGALASAAAQAAVTRNIYDEHGNLLGSVTQPAVSSQTNAISGRDWTTESTSTYTWIKVAPMLQRFGGINNLLLTILPVVSIAGFLGISGAKLYMYGKGTASIGSAISTSIFTLIAIVVAMIIAGPIMGAAVDANQVVVSGQYQVNGTFGNIIQLLFAMIPIVYIAGLVTLVGLQARSALMGIRQS